MKVEVEYLFKVTIGEHTKMLNCAQMGDLAPDLNDAANLTSNGDFEDIVGVQAYLRDAIEELGAEAMLKVFSEV